MKIKTFIKYFEKDVEIFLKNHQVLINMYIVKYFIVRL